MNPNFGIEKLRIGGYIWYVAQQDLIFYKKQVLFIQFKIILKK